MRLLPWTMLRFVVGRCWIASLASTAVVASLAGCASQSRGPVNSPEASAALTELGATRTAWVAHHTPDTRNSSQANFLPLLTDGQDKYTEIAYVNERVIAITLHFEPGRVDEAAAKHAAAPELPADSRLVFDVRKYSAGSEADDQCDLLQYQSKLIGQLFPENRSGIITVKLSRRTEAGFGPYDRTSVTVADIYAVGSLNDVPTEC